MIFSVASATSCRQALPLIANQLYGFLYVVSGQRALVEEALAAVLLNRTRFGIFQLRHTVFH